jgi:hypothetical protein
VNWKPLAKKQFKQIKLFKELLSNLQEELAMVYKQRDQTVTSVYNTEKALVSVKAALNLVMVELVKVTNEGWAVRFTQYSKEVDRKLVQIKKVK